MSRPRSVDEATLTYRPDEGSARATRWRATAELAGGELIVVMNDLEVPRDFLPELDFEMNEEVELAYVDAVEAAGDHGAAGVDAYL